MNRMNENTTKSYSSKKILITGGLGFIGSNLAHSLVGIGAKVFIIDNLNPLYGGNKYNIKDIEKDVVVMIDDIRNNETLLPVIKDVDIIFHLAAQVSYIDSLNFPFEDLDLSARATLNILELCRKYNSKAKIIFTSSRMVLGKVEEKAVTELSPTNPLSLYGIHKLTSEKYLRMYYKDFGIQSVILRLSNPYGPRQQIKHSKYSLVGWFVRQAMEGKTIDIFGDGEQLRDYIYSIDITNALLLCGSTPSMAGEIFNLGSGRSVAFREMVEKVIQVVGNGAYRIIPWPENYEKIETGDITFDISKLQSYTGWQPAYTLEEGIRGTYRYYSEHLKEYI
jgi:UDP-glucose 4-epimerase